MTNLNILSYHLFLLLASLSVITKSHSDLIQELISLRSSSYQGVIPLNDKDISHFITSLPIPRPYSLIIFFDSIDLEDLRQEFGIVSTSFIANNNRYNTHKLFFIIIDSTHSKSFSVETLLHICLIDLKNETVKMQTEYYNAETITEFIELQTKLTVRPLKRPPVLKKAQIVVISTLILISIPLLVKEVIKGETILHDRRLWLFGAIFVYFFSVSGTMYNIINEVPLYVEDYEEPNKNIFFFEGSGMQLSGEGYVIGLLYTVVGLSLAFVTNVLVRVKDTNKQRIGMVICTLVSFWAVKEVIYLDN